MHKKQKTDLNWTVWLFCKILDYKCNFILYREKKSCVSVLSAVVWVKPTNDNALNLSDNMTFLPMSCSVWLSWLITLTKAETRHYLSTLTPTLRLLPRQSPAAGTKPELGWNASVAVKLHGGAFLIGCSASWLSLFRAGRKALQGFINGALVAEPERYSMGLLVQLVRITREWFIITSSGTWGPDFKMGPDAVSLGPLHFFFPPTLRG